MLPSGIFFSVCSRPVLAAQVWLTAINLKSQLTLEFLKAKANKTRRNHPKKGTNTDGCGECSAAGVRREPKTHQGIARPSGRPPLGTLGKKVWKNRLATSR